MTGVCVCVCVCVFFKVCYLGLCEFSDWLEFDHVRHHLKMIPIYCMMAKRYVFETLFFEVGVSKMLCWLLLPLSLGKWLNLTSISMFKLWSNGLPTDCLSHTYGKWNIPIVNCPWIFCCCYSCFSDISLLTPTSTRTRCIAILSYSPDFFSCTNGTITVYRLAQISWRIHLLPVLSFLAEMLHICTYMYIPRSDG